MGRGDARHSGALLRRTTAGLVALVLALAGAAYGFDLGPRWLGWEGPSPVTEPAEVLPPAGLDLAEPVAAPAVAAPAAGPAVDPVKVRRAIGPLLRDRDLGPHVAVLVAEQGSDAPVFRSGTGPVTPASTLKLLTTAAALEAMGPEHTFRTTVVDGASPTEIVLVGGGDPLLARVPAAGSTYPARADLATLADQTARSLTAAGRRAVSVGYDASLFTGPAVNPAWPTAYVLESVVSPITALWVDEGREVATRAKRSADPALAAAAEFARMLRARGIVVRGAPRSVLAPPDATEVAAVESAPLAQLVQRILEASDNEATEVLLRHVALAEGRPASFAGGTQAVGEVLTRLGIDLTGARILDGSGLSRRNLLAPETLLAVLRVAAAEENPHLRPVVADLPVAGFTGSLSSRFVTGNPAGRGVVRAKTGTLTGVHGLAGVVTDADGTVLSFVAVADRVRLLDTLDARETLDQVAAALAGCSCAA